MKNVCLFAAVVFFSTISVQAQNSTDLIQFGVKGGVNFSTVTVKILIAQKEELVSM